jgi:hypothetical protein
VLSLNNLEFMLDCSIISIFKIYLVASDVDREEISFFINENFSENTEISFKRMLTWCSKCTEIQKFFEVIKKELPKLIVTIKNPKVNVRPQRREISSCEFLEIEARARRTARSIQYTYQEEQDEEESDTKRLQNQIEWVHSFSRQLNYTISTQRPLLKLTATLNWVFGFKCKEVVKSFFYHNQYSMPYKEAEERHK